MGLIAKLSNPEFTLPTPRAGLTQRRPALPFRQRQVRLTDGSVARLVASRRSGATIAEVAEDFRVHRTTVMAYLRRAREAKP